MSISSFPAPGYTSDIDTCTPDYPQEVKDTIHQIANELHLEKEWLNNDMVLEDTETVEDMLDAFWLPQDIGLKNIELYIADEETLINAKIMASDDVELTGRFQDPLDMIDLIKHQNLETLEDFEMDYPNTRYEFPNAFKIIQKYYAGKI